MGRPTRFAIARVMLRIRETRGAEPHTKGVGRMSTIRFVGLDVHADTISVAVAHFNIRPQAGRVPPTLNVATSEDYLQGELHLPRSSGAEDSTGRALTDRGIWVP